MNDESSDLEVENERNGDPDTEENMDVEGNLVEDVGDDNENLKSGIKRKPNIDTWARNKNKFNKEKCFNFKRLNKDGNGK